MNILEYSGSVIYMIINLINNDIYIGSAKSFKVRARNHINQLRKNVNKCKHLQNAWNKYGEDNFCFEIIEYIDSKEKLIQREQLWLDLFYPEYNICLKAGSTLGRTCSEETKLKISNKNKGKTRSEETKIKMSESRKGDKHYLYGKKQKPESIIKMSDTKKKNMTPEKRERMRILSIGNKHCIGREMSKETRDKIGEANRGKVASAETKRIMSEKKKGEKNVNYGKRGGKSYIAKKINQYDKKGNLVTSFDSIVEASKTGCFFANTIVACCKGKRNSHGGYVWKYADELENEKAHKLIEKRRNKKTEEHIKRGIEKSKRVAQINADGYIVMIWDSFTQAHNGGGFDISHIGACCNGKEKTHLGFIWKYADQALSMAS